MWFNSWEFLLFFPTVWLVYAGLQQRSQNHWLLLASYFFYGWWDWRFLALILASTLVDFFAAQKIHAASEAGARKRWLLLSLIFNLGMLATFKYFNFFVDSFIALGDSVGLNLDTPALRLLPPVGISFYTFQTLSYTIDVFRRQQKPISQFGDFALFVCFFPQLVAGPIERAHDLLPQVQRRRVLRTQDLHDGLVLLLIGLFRKVAIADSAAQAVDKAFASPAAYDAATLLGALYLFALQIYGDFSGYSTMARGMARLLGFRLTENFQTPYFATSITDFWRRWHITLSRWLRDYLYIPLGGNRKGKTRTLINLMLTMLLGGLWHGAAWTFVVWGGLHGLMLMLHRQWRQLMPARDALWRRLFSWALTFAGVCLAWVFFRAPDFVTAMDYFAGFGRISGAMDLSNLKLGFLLTLLLLPIDFLQHRRADVLAVMRLHWGLRGLTYALLFLAIVLLGGHEVPFIYFQF